MRITEAAKMTMTPSLGQIQTDSLPLAAPPSAGRCLSPLAQAEAQRLAAQQHCCNVHQKHVAARQDQAHAQCRADLAQTATEAAEASRQANEAFERTQTERALNLSALAAQRAAAGLQRSDSTSSSSSWEARRAAIWRRDQSWQARRDAINNANPGAGGSGGGGGADGGDPDADQLAAERATARWRLAYSADECSYEEGHTESDEGDGADPDSGDATPEETPDATPDSA